VIDSTDHEILLLVSSNGGGRLRSGSRCGDRE